MLKHHPDLTSLDGHMRHLLRAKPYHTPLIKPLKASD
jgi:hypothetical protein